MKLQLGISEAIAHWAKYNANAPCVIHETCCLSFQDLNAIVNYLAENEFCKVSEQCVPIMIESKVLLLSSIVAAIRCNKVPVILNPYCKTHELEFALDHLGAKAIFAEERFTSQIPVRYSTYVLDALQVEGKLEYSTALTWPPPDLESTWGILFSSGTTGNPKGIDRSHFSILSELLGWCFELETRRTSHYYIARPLYYTGGLMLAMTCLLVGGKVSLYDRFAPDLYLSHLENDLVELSFLVPSQISALIDYVKANGITEPAHSRMVLSMGAAFPEQLKIEARKHLRSDILESWGNTEGLGTITTQTDLDQRPSSIGKPFLTDELFIVDESHHRVGANVIGRLSGKVDSHFTRYSHSTNESNETVVEDGMIISEDLGIEDSEGYFYLYGRASDVIATEHGTIYPMLIEKKIASVDGIEEVAVIGVPAGSFEVPVVVVKLRSQEVNAEALLKRLNAILGEHDKMTQLRIVAEFPKTASGKITKKELTALFAS